MHKKIIVSIFAVALVLAAVPLVVMLPHGVARAGLSYGFLMVLQNISHLSLVLVVGVWASLMGREAPLMLPVAFILMFVIGSFAELDIAQYRLMHMFMLGAVLLFSLVVSLMPRRRVFAVVAVSGSLSYHLGAHYMQQLPLMADPLFYIIGEVLSLALIFATSVSFGAAFCTDTDWARRLRAEPEVSAAD